MVRDPKNEKHLYQCSVDDKAVFFFVSDANARHSEWLETVSPTDRHGLDALNFCNLSGCEQFVR